MLLPRPILTAVLPRSYTSHLAVHVSLYIENWDVYRYLPTRCGEPPYKPTHGGQSLSDTVWDNLCPMRKTFYQHDLKLGANEASAQGLQMPYRTSAVLNF
jgi:hypothetical protein